MALDAYILSMQAPVWRVFAALILLSAAAFGAGTLLLRRRDDPFMAFALGVVLLGVAGLLPWRLLPDWVQPLLLLPAAGCGLRFLAAGGLRFPRWMLLLALSGAVTAASALLPPYSWDEQVYQTLLPIRFPSLPILSDNPYSAYPLLPQFFLRWGILPGGLNLPRMAVWAVTLILAAKLFMEIRRRWGGAGGAVVLTATVMLSPMSLALQRSFYAESFVALFTLAGWLALTGDDDCRRGAVLGGIFAGACFAVKLTGAGVALMLFIIALKNRRAAWFILSAAVVSVPFFIRPLLGFGNPFYPFGACWWGPESSAAVETFFRELGSYRYGLCGIPGVALGWLFACFASRVYDGVVCGFGVMVMVVLLAVAVLLHRRDRAVLLPAAALLAGYCFWALSSQQTRFLYPLLFPAALLLSDCVSAIRPSRAGWLPAAALLLGVILSWQWEFPALRHYLTAWRVVAEARRRPAEFLSRASDPRYFQTLERICRMTDPSSRVLLLFERRGLYLPRTFGHGTPYFQERRFTPPPDSPEEFFAGVRDFDYILLGSSRGKVDHLKRYDAVEEAMSALLLPLIHSGKLRPLYPPQPASCYLVFEVVHER